MLRLIQGMQSNRYDLPTENQIQQVITVIVSDEKMERSRAAGERIDTENESGVDRDVYVSGTGVDNLVGSNAYVSQVGRSSQASSNGNGTKRGNEEERTFDGEVVTGNDSLETAEGGNCEGNNGDDMPSGSVFGSGEYVSKVRVLYRMPELYADYLKMHVLRNPEYKRMEARGIMIQEFGYADRPLPENFPT